MFTELKPVDHLTPWGEIVARVAAARSIRATGTVVHETPAQVAQFAIAVADEIFRLRPLDAEDPSETEEDEP